jgi:hypothetical protein
MFKGCFRVVHLLIIFSQPVIGEFSRMERQKLFLFGGDLSIVLSDKNILTQHLFFKVEILVELRKLEGSVTFLILEVRSDFLV